MSSLQGKKALVTGGSRGIGAAVVRCLAEKGADVAFTYQSSRETAAQLVAQVQTLGRKALAIQADSANPAAVGNSVDRAAAEFGGLDILVNNAGICRVGPLTEMSMEDIQQLLDVNLRAVIVATRHAIPHMRGGGRIINIGSNLAERVHMTGIAIYAATKSALVSLTRGWARDFGPKGIAVTLVNPGPTDTDMNPASSPLGESLRGDIPMGRYGKPAEVAEVIAFVAGPGGAHISGTCVAVDGGFNA